jgi:hypothetical protein
MKEENPFDYEMLPVVPEEFFLIHITDWEWMKSENLDNDNSELFYDESQDGRMFCSEKNLCPDCDYHAVIVTASAGYEHNDNPIAKDWVCLRCGIGGDVVGCHGRTVVFEDNKDILGNWADLPSHVVAIKEAK